MKKLFLLVLLLIVSNAWARESTATASPDTSAISSTETPVDETSAASPGPTADSSDASTGSASETPESHSVVLPKPPALTAASSTPAVNTPGTDRFVFQIDGGVVPAVSSAAATQLGMGYGFDARMSYALDDFFSMGLEMGFYDFGLNASVLNHFRLPSGATANMSHIPLLGVFQIGLGESGALIQPYLILAAGFALDAYNLQVASFASGVPNSYTNFEFDPGLGVAFALNRNMNLFVQGEFAMDFDNNASGSSGQIADTPIIFIPLQAGLNFNLY